MAINDFDIKKVVDRLRQFADAQDRNAENSNDPYRRLRYLHGSGVLMDAANDIAGEEPWPGRLPTATLTDRLDDERTDAE